MPLLRILSASAAAVALAATASGCNNSSSAATGHNTAKDAGNPTVKGTLDEWSVGVSTTKVSSGDVTFDVTNAGKAKHEFVVLRTDKAADQLGRGARVSEAGHVGETGDVAPGATKSVTLRLPPGHYSLVCNLPGHYHAGMHTDFTVS